jgi:CheY-like chemotaxis protein
VSITALVVDDHAGFRTSARFLLEMEGFVVVGEAADGAAALEAVDRLRPELVLLDAQLPDAQGGDVARRIFERGPFLDKAELSGDRLRTLVGQDASCS